MSEKRKSKLSIINNIMKPISPPRRKHNNETSEDPVKMPRKAPIPALLTFPSFSQFDGPNERNFDSRNVRQNLGLNTAKCAFCDELLSKRLAGEMGLQLACSHMCHRYCYLTMMDRDDLDALPFCTHCGQKAQCVNASTQTDLKRQKIVESPQTQYHVSSHIPFDSVISKPFDSLVKSPISTAETQLLSPISTPTSASFNENLYREISKPRVLVTLDEPILLNKGEYDLDCLVNVKPPQISDCPADSSDDIAAKSNIIRDVKIKLALSVTNWQDSLMPLNDLGNLWMFDFLEISSNGTDWDSIRCYFFHNAILLVDCTGTHLMGQVLIHEDISSINKIEDGISLNLSNEVLPELYIRHACSLIILKWEFYLTQAVSKIDVGPIPLLHTTTNAWELVEESYRSVDGIEFCNLVEKNTDVPSSLLTKMMPPPEKVPLNINVSISLINNSDISNFEYKESIVSFLQKLLLKLRPIDKLGLIFVGVNGHGMPFKDGTFIGCVGASWDGWDNILRDIRVFSNYDDKELPIFDNGFEELLISFNKCKQLLPFIPPEQKNNNRLIILNSSNYETSDPKRNPITKVKEGIGYLLEHENLTIDFVRIGKEYSTEAQEAYALLSNPFGDQDSLSISLGSKFLRFDTYSEFIDAFDFIMEYKLQSEYMPYVTIDLKKFIDTENINSFSEVEINGEMTSIPQKSSNLRLIVKNVFPHTQRNIMMKFKLKIPEMQYNWRSVIEYSIASYQSLSIKGHDELKYLKTRVTGRSSPRILFSDESDISGSPLDQVDGDSYFVDIPLLPPLSSSRDQSFARRKTELAIIKSLRTAAYSTIEEIENVLSHLISLVFGIIRGFDGIPEEPFYPLESKCSLNNWKNFMLHFEVFNNNPRYIQRLVSDLELINKMFRIDSSSALVKCQDLANWIM